MSGAPPKKKIESYQDLLVWQKSMDLVAACYKVALKLSPTEQFGLSSQIRCLFRSCKYRGRFWQAHAKEFVRFLLLANGSVKELETHLLIGKRIGLLSLMDIEASAQLCGEISKMIFALRDKLSK